MKRENFQITYENNIVIKHKWNSSIREIERIVMCIARFEKCKYELVQKTKRSIKDKSGIYFVEGIREWKSENGKLIKFEIKKLSGEESKS